jgi:RNA polymerase sigma-70 factor (ECF subfamily)
MPTPEQLAERFEEHRPHLRAVAYRMLGSASARRERRRRTGRDVLEERSVQISLSSSTGILGCRAARRPAVFVVAFTIAGGKVVEIDILAYPERLSRLDLSALEG